MEELQIDPTAEGFSEEKLIEKLIEKSFDKETPYSQREKYKHLAKVIAPHKYWDTQPLMTLKGKNPKEGLIKQYSKEELLSEPAALPPGFEWGTFDLSNDEVCKEVADFLTQSYVESETGDFRVLYTPEKLRWSCCSPGYHPRYHVAVRNSKNKKLMATIVLIPKKCVILGKSVKVAEVNFLAVHRALREKRLAQLMIQEATRLTYLHDSQIGFYTATRSMPTPFCTSKDYFRILDPAKALDIKMCFLTVDTTRKQFMT